MNVLRIYWQRNEMCTICLTIFVRLLSQHNNRLASFVSNDQLFQARLVQLLQGNLKFNRNSATNEYDMFGFLLKYGNKLEVNVENIVSDGRRKWNAQSKCLLIACMLRRLLLRFLLYIYFTFDSILSCRKFCQYEKKAK